MKKLKQTLQQERAQHALKRIQDAAEKYEDNEDRKKFVSYAESTPASILINGLGQAMATLLAQAKGDQNDPHWAIYDALKDWLCRDNPIAPYKGCRDLITAITEGDRDSYLYAQAEALAYLEWYKKFAVAFMKTD
ncbi:MAG: type III-B CRISPR module-associated protein Cmr5 [Dethiobacteria bacterium]|jgi:CRISPR-associated protein Cmr5|nr:type III-B CRISPR module-associated protein Cmr5 [Bacillota bacterium]